MFLRKGVQIYRRTPMPKYDFNNLTSVWVFSCKFAAYFQNAYLRAPLDGCFCMFKWKCSFLSFLIQNHPYIRSSRPEVFCKSLHLVKKETLAQVFSCEFCEISKNNFFTEYLWAPAPGNSTSTFLYFN